MTPTEIDVAKSGGAVTLTCQAPPAARGRSRTRQLGDRHSRARHGERHRDAADCRQPASVSRSATFNVAGDLIIIRQSNVDGLAAPVNPRVIVQ